MLIHQKAMKELESKVKLSIPTHLDENPFVFLLRELKMHIIILAIMSSIIQA
jgi:hypothetical protein